MVLKEIKSIHNEAKASVRFQMCFDKYNVHAPLQFIKIFCNLFGLNSFYSAPEFLKVTSAVLSTSKLVKVWVSFDVKILIFR